MKKWIIALIVVIAIGALGGLDYIGPAWTLKSMQAAAQANDSDTVAAHVDFEALRTDLKQELRGRMNAEGGSDSIAESLGDAFIDPLVDAVVTPRGIRTLFDARASGSVGAGLGAGAISMPSLGSGDPVVARTGINSFTVTAPNGRGALVFTRPFPFFGWKLSGVDLPAEQPADAAAPTT